MGEHSSYTNGLPYADHKVDITDPLLHDQLQKIKHPAFFRSDGIKDRLRPFQKYCKCVLPSCPGGKKGVTGSSRGSVFWQSSCRLAGYLAQPGHGLWLPLRHR